MSTSRALLGALLSACAAAGSCAGSPPRAVQDPALAPAPAPPQVVAVQTAAFPRAILLEWRRGKLGADRAEIAAEVLREGGVWAPADFPRDGDLRFDSRLYEDVAPGTYRFALTLFMDGREVGLGASSPVEVAVRRPPLRFLERELDLGLAAPLDLRLLLSVPRSAAPQVAPGVHAEFEEMAARVLESAFGAVERVDLEELRAIEDARDLLLASTAGQPPALPESLAAEVLAVVQLVTPGGDLASAQLGCKLFDVSYRRYQLEQPERRLWNTRPLIFEDAVALDGELLRDGRTLEAFADAWRELLREVAADPMFSSYRTFLKEHAGPAAWEASAQKELLGQLGLDLSTTDPGANFKLVEERFLFARQGTARAPAPAAWRPPEPEAPDEPAPSEPSDSMEDQPGAPDTNGGGDGGEDGGAADPGGA